MSRYLNFFLDILEKKKKRLDYKDKVNFEIYDLIAWLKKNYNIHCSISHELEQLDNEIWSVNRI